MIREWKQKGWRINNRCQAPLIDKTENAKSMPLAVEIQNALVRVGFRKRGVKQGEFYVLKHTKAPRLLLEIGFIDNRADNRLFDVIVEVAFIEINFYFSYVPIWRDSRN